MLCTTTIMSHMGYSAPEEMWPDLVLHPAL